MDKQKSEITELAIIIPVFNSFDYIIESNNQIFTAVNEHFESFEIIYVLDGGTHQEWDRLKEIQRKKPKHTSVIRLNKNFGQHHATYCGLVNADANYYVTIDDDLQFSPKEIIHLYNYIKDQKLDIVYGSYGTNNQVWWRRVSGRALRKIANLVGKGFGNATSFRIINNRIVDQLKAQFYSFIFLDEVFLLFTEHIGFFNVKHHKRIQGKSNYTFFSLLKLALKIILFHSSVSIRLVTRVGLLLSMSIILIVFSLLLFNIVGILNLDFSNLLDCLILVVLSFIIFSIAVVGEFIKKVHSFTSFQPSFVVKDKVQAS